MFEDITKAIRAKKKNKLRPDMDYAGQIAVDPNEAWDEKQNQEVSKVLDSPDHEPASASMMGENESSQSEEVRKKISSRIKKYFDGLL